MKLISGYIRGQVAKYLAPHVLDGTLVKVTPGTRNPAATASGTNPTETQHGCSYFMKKSRESEMANSSVAQSKRVIAILGGTIEGEFAPAPNDKFIDDKGNVWRIVEDGVDFDPDEAVYSCTAWR